MTFIKNYDQLATSDTRKLVLDLIEKAFAAIVPQEVMKKNFSLSEDTLTIQDKTFDLQQYTRIFVIGFGKGSAEICRILEENLKDKLTAGYDIDVVDETLQRVTYTKGTHPLPSQENFDNTEKVISKLNNLTEKDLVIVVTCGGGSVLFEKPHTFTLDQMISVNKALLASGATISEMNVIRKHLSQVKGGGLAKILYPATIANLIFSDVPGNDLSVIASAPLVHDPTTVQDAITICAKYHLTEKELLKPADFIETPKEEKFFKNVHNILMVSNQTSIQAMQQYAEKQGLKVSVLTDRLQGDAKETGKYLLTQAENMVQKKAGQVLLAGGETTVKVKGKGRGGRNQELVLSSLPFITENVTIASFGTDGWDFYGLAGAIADTETLKKVKELRLDAKAFLDDDNSYEFWQKVGDGIETGKQESNVSDLYIVFKK